MVDGVYDVVSSGVSVLHYCPTILELFLRLVPGLPKMEWHNIDGDHDDDNDNDDDDDDDDGQVRIKSTETSAQNVSSSLLSRLAYCIVVHTSCFAPFILPMYCSYFHIVGPVSLSHNVPFRATCYALPCS